MYPFWFICWWIEHIFSIWRNPECCCSNPIWKDQNFPR